MGTTTTDDAAAVNVSEDELAVCISVLRRFDTSQGLAHLQTSRFQQLRLAVLSLADDFRGSCPLLRPRSNVELNQEHRRVERAHNRARDKQLIDSTTLRAGRRSKLAVQTAKNPLVPQVPDGAVSCNSLLELGSSEKAAAVGLHGKTRTLYYPRQCYVCNLKYKQLHHFYDRLCPPCAKLNYEKRLQTADLRDHVAIVTGARVKIGYEITLKLLRSGAMVIATTRFPKDAAYRFARERDFDAWKDKLQIYGMDFRDLGVIDKFMDHVATTFGSIDILINNATQTIRRPVHYYKHLIKSEVAPIPEELNGVEQILRGNASLLGISGTMKPLCGQDPHKGALVKVDVASHKDVVSSVLLSQVAVVSEDVGSKETSYLFPEGQFDVNNQQVDLRTSNSWVAKIDHVETMELVEVFAINTIAPFILNKRVIPLLEKSTNKHKFIINVSAMEGKFNRPKTSYHPHTNMAKAAANMMTRTAAADLATRGIFMNSVDTGWVNDENPRHIAVEKAATMDFQTPLDEIDAAARVLDPIFALHQPQNGKKPLVFGQFLKDFGISKW
uniref:Oxidoreductase n=1 Tax=Globisporangium ultimum (strain ATCC 200006 / CBS 805.95 / DAOM BR144) TaxID=431595 RepID=K3X2E1_GLOUD